MKESYNLEVSARDVVNLRVLFGIIRCNPKFMFGNDLVIKLRIDAPTIATIGRVDDALRDFGYESDESTI